MPRLELVYRRAAASSFNFRHGSGLPVPGSGALVVHSSGRVCSLGRRCVVQALEALSCLEDCEAKRSLAMMVEYVLDRLY